MTVSDSNSAGEPWRSGVFPGDPDKWYAQDPVIYSVPEPYTAAEIESARRFLSQWLSEDSHGFVIPDSEWGRSLLGHLHNLVGATGEARVRGEAVDPAHLGQRSGA